MAPQTPAHFSPILPTIHNGHSPSFSLHRAAHSLPLPPGLLPPALSRRPWLGGDGGSLPGEEGRGAEEVHCALHRPLGGRARQDAQAPQGDHPSAAQGLQGQLVRGRALLLEHRLLRRVSRGVERSCRQDDLGREGSPRPLRDGPQAFHQEEWLG